MNKLEEWTKRFRNKWVRITKGINNGRIGRFQKVVSYSDRYGAVVSIKLVGIAEAKFYNPDSFEFVNELVQEEWDKDD
jgi:hypothetical protein